MNNTLGERIREKRKAKGLTIRDMGEVLNLSYSIVAKYERNEVPITTIMLEKLAKILGTTTEYLLKGDSDSDSIDINNFSNKRLGDTIKYLRKSKGLTQTELGNKFGVTKTAVSNWEKNLREPNIETLEQLASYFNVILDDLVNGINDSNNKLGDKIKQLRLAKGLSQEKLGELIGVNVQNVYRYEKGMITDLPISRIEKLAEALDTTIEYLVGDSQLIGLGNRLKQLRNNAGLTQDELANRLNKKYNRKLSKITISKIENGERNLSQKMSKIYSEFFNVSLDYLLNGTESIQPEPYVENLGVEIIPVIQTIDQVDYVSSRTIAEQLGKRHGDVITQLENILENENVRSLIIPSTYKVEGQNREYKEYLLTRDGFTLYMFNIQGYNDFKIAYIQKFNEMEQLLLNRTRDELYKLKFMSFKLDLLYKILSGTSTPKDFDDWKNFIFNNDMNEELLACEVKNRERYNARGNKIKTITLEFETMDDPVLTRIPVL